MRGTRDDDQHLDRRRSRSRSNSHVGEREHDRHSSRRKTANHESRSRRHRYDSSEEDEEQRERRYRDRARWRRSRSPQEKHSNRHSRIRDLKDGVTDSRANHNEDGEKVSRELSQDERIAVTNRRDGPLPSQEESFSIINGRPGKEGDALDKPPIEKQKPNFNPTGILAAESNSITQADGTAIVLKYHEPPEARKPAARDQWKLFVFKGAETMETLELGNRSCWLVGRELAVVDMLAEHPSISKQHAVIQFRYIEKRNEFGDRTGKVKPYLIDLESSNGSSLNNDRIPASRYVELRDKDMIQFGHSTREYVLMLAPRD